MEFSQYKYISTLAFQTSPFAPKDASFQLGFHLAKHFTSNYDIKTLDNNFLQSGRDNNIRRGTLLVSGVYLWNEQLFLHNLLHTGSFICCWYDIQSISESQQFPFIRFCFFHLFSSPGPFTFWLTVSDRTNLQPVVHHFRRKNKTDNSAIQGPKRGGGGSLEPWSPEIFVVERVFGALEPWNFCLGARSLKSLSTWSLNKSAILWLKGALEWSNGALEPQIFHLGVLEPSIF